MSLLFSLLRNIIGLILGFILYMRQGIHGKRKKRQILLLSLIDLYLFFSFIPLLVSEL